MRNYNGSSEYELLRNVLDGYLSYCQLPLNKLRVTFYFLPRSLI